MSDEMSPENKKPLVSIERQYETDVATGKTEVRVFVKMYVEARDSGLLAALGDRRWRTLCCLATYMDENGNCHPSQDEMARKLGVRRENVNLRIQELLAFRFNDRPVISVAKTRIQTSDGSRWDKNLYRVHPISGLAIFDHKRAEDPERNGSEPSVRKIAHRPVCEKTNTGKSHINQNQRLNQKVLNPLPNNDQKIPRREGRPTPVISDRALSATYALGDAQLAQVHYLVAKQGDVLGSIEKDHGHFVKRAAEAVAGGHADLLDETLSRLKDIARKSSVDSEPAYFQTMWNEALERRQAEVRRTPASGHSTSSRRSGFEPLGEILRAPRPDGEAPPPDETSLA